MEANYDKEFNKYMCTLFGTFEIIFFILVGAFVIGSVFNLGNTANVNAEGRTAITVILLSIAIVLEVIRQVYRGKLSDYKAKLQKYRSDFKAKKILRLLADNKLDEAISLYETGLEDVYNFTLYLEAMKVKINFEKEMAEVKENISKLREIINQAK